jgi:hypothetical protein
VPRIVFDLRDLRSTQKHEPIVEIRPLLQMARSRSDALPVAAVRLVPNKIERRRRPK